MGSPDEYPQPQILDQIRWWYTRYIEAADGVVLLDHGIQPLACQRRRSPRRHLEGLLEEPAREGVIGPRPTPAGVEPAPGWGDPPRRRLHLPGVDVPAGHGAQEARPLG